MWKELIPLTVPEGNSSDWAPQVVLASPLGIAQVNAVGHFPLVLPVPKPLRRWTSAGMRIVGVGMTIDPPGGHGALPAQMPRIRLLRQSTLSSSAPTAIADVTDASGSVGAYEIAHKVETAALDQAVEDGDDFAYNVVITGEDSTNAAPGLVVTSVYLLTSAA
jgi:hypothetical protein